MCQSLINGDYTYFLPQNYNAWRSRRERDEEGSQCLQCDDGGVAFVDRHLSQEEKVSKKCTVLS